MPSKTLAEMTAEVREINIEKGWRAPDGPLPGQTYGERIALLHSEISEALEAFRDHELDDPTMPHCAEPGCPRYGKVATAALCAVQADGTWHPSVPGKPEGVGSELADVLIRLLDLCDVFRIKLFDMDMELADVAGYRPHPLAILREIRTFGDYLAWLHHEVDQMYWSALADQAALTLRALVTITQAFGIDLMAEYERKVAFNRTRSFRHGGRVL